jgi:hypothetical protein
MICNSWFLSKNAHLVILQIYAYVLLTYVKEDDFVSMIALTALACMAVVYIKKSTLVLEKKVEGNTTKPTTKRLARSKKPLTRSKKSSVSPKKPLTHTRGKEGFANIEGQTNGPSPQSNSTENSTPPGANLFLDTAGMTPMGPYDGIVLSTNNSQCWRGVSDVPLSNAPPAPLLGNQAPPKPVVSNQSTEEPKFLFTDNYSSPNCCPGTFSTSTGCVCTTKGQRDRVAGRGGNGGRGEF